ncbi:hypothetical protein BDV38DRAFT_244204 [Aspergillus pseudotamarii]|uniref:Azaphilone pigments biosynthesis cluster protein L N-terminal domain-containing protein n=1 Tax=Aspergillus pseudotamarii TaxID=132259 RepID=A0A5N6SZT8_ASPPS|nr:uncharacterized protein BDV38DRAFT_244204 [Aspergillus pseudotamarii]KAE8138644.1 hypothetical protein BDV38DRAFT_244204 [Aspergillus pseudotamarii]
MADPLSVTASAVGIITAAIQSARSLVETIKRFRDRDKTLRRLQEELRDLTNILDALAQVNKSEMSMLALLEDPVNRCSQVCREFEGSMKAFGAKSKTGLRDWAKLEFMRGDINEFIDTIAGYKSTISVGLGTITMQTTKISQQVLEEYNEMVQDTAYSLEVQLQRIDEKLARMTMDTVEASEVGPDLNDEKQVTKQCLRICQDAKSYIETLTNRGSSLLQGTSRGTDEDGTQKVFEAQLLTRQALDKNRDTFTDIIGQLGKRLEILLLTNGPNDDNDRQRLKDDISISMQCLEVCKVATEVSRQKIYKVGEVVAEENSDQVVVTTLADLFDVKKASSTGNSAQLVGSMTEDALCHLTEKRYSSRFGAVTGTSHNTEVTTTPSRSPSSLETQKNKHSSAPQASNDEQASSLGMRRSAPSPNEMRKRATSGTTD